MEKKFSLIAVVTIIPSLVPSVAWASGATESVKLIEGGVFPFFVAADKMIDPSAASKILHGSNACNCKYACFAAGNKCNAWSVTTLNDNSSECRLAKNGPLQTTPVNDTSSKYFFKHSAINGTYKWGGDGFLYVELNQKFSDVDGKAQCASIPGHRLIMVKTLKTFEFFITHISDGSVFYLSDLSKVDETTFVWGDGTFYRDTELTADHIVNNSGPNERIFMLYQRKLNDCSPTRCGPFKILCQVNPLGVAW